VRLRLLRGGVFLCASTLRALVRLELLRAAWFRALELLGRRGFVRLRTFAGGGVSCAFPNFLAGAVVFMALRTFAAAWFRAPSNF